VRPDDVTVESEMDDLDQVRRHFGLDSMAVLGHSWGGVLAMEYASRHPERLTHLILMNTAPASNRDVHLWRQHLHRIRPADDVEAMQFLAATEEFCAGDLEVESEYYRIHYRPALYAPALLDRLIPRLRASFTPDRVLTARAIEQRLYDETWSSPGTTSIRDCVVSRFRPSSSMARTTSFRSACRRTLPGRCPRPDSLCCSGVATSRTWRHPTPWCSTSASYSPLNQLQNGLGQLLRGPLEHRGASFEPVAAWQGFTRVLMPGRKIIRI
jgi:pimeloyl-ACP methyl ester carboxylesterase